MSKNVAPTSQKTYVFITKATLIMLLREIAAVDSYNRMKYIQT